MPDYDLLLKGGHVIDPAAGIDKVRDVAFKDGKVAAVSAGIDASAATDVRDVSGRIVTPGLIDMHTHVYWGGNVARDRCRGVLPQECRDDGG